MSNNAATETNVIELLYSKGDKQWMVHYPVGNPARELMIELLHSDTACTEFTDKHTEAEVVAEFTQRNSRSIIRVIRP